MLERVKEKVVKRKSEQNDNDKRSKNAQCEEEGGWKLEDEQLKAYWECYPLPATSFVTEKLKTGTQESQMQMEKRAEAAGSRKNLIKALRSSINEKFEVDAKGGSATKRNLNLRILGKIKVYSTGTAKLSLPREICIVPEFRNGSYERSPTSLTPGSVDDGTATW